MAAIHLAKKSKTVRWILLIIFMAVLGAMTYLIRAPHLCATGTGCDL